MVETRMQITSEQVAKYTRIGLHYVAGMLVMYGYAAKGATWIEPAIGVGVGLASLIWMRVGDTVNAKIAAVAKLILPDGTRPLIATDPVTALAIPATNVIPKSAVEIK